jgi:WD40 repeat protein
MHDELREIQLRQMRIELERRVASGEPTPLRTYVQQHPALTHDVNFLLELLYAEVVAREERGEIVEVAEYIATYPEHSERIARLFEVHHELRDDFPEVSSPHDTVPEAGSTHTNQVADDTSSSALLDNGIVMPTIPGYRLLERLGAGGAGIVYRAEQTKLGRTVAIKMLRAGSVNDAGTRRFRLEAESTAKLQHPNIVRVYDISGTDTALYISMEYIAGGSLTDVLRNRVYNSTEAAAIASKLARAIHYAHTQQIIHRDLKPANILLDAAGEPKIADFGLAKALDAESTLVATRTHALLGTPSYMAPEQFNPAYGGTGVATDVYGLGAVLYEMLTGRPPFVADSVVETLKHIENQEVVLPSRLQDVPRDLETICLKCLEKQPLRRFASALDLAQELERFLEGKPLRIRRIPVWEHAWRWSKRRPAIASLIAALCLLTASAFAIITSQWREAQRGWTAADSARRTIDAALYSQQISLAYREWLVSNNTRAEQLLDASDPAFRGWEHALVSAMIRSETMRITGHTLDVWDVEWTRDGTKLISSAGSWTHAVPGEAIVWNARTGERLLSLTGHRGAVFDIAIAPDDRQVATCEFHVDGSSGKVRTWDLASGQLLHEYETFGTMTIDYSPSDSEIAVAGIAGQLAILDAQNLRPIQSIHAHSQLVTQLKYAPDGKSIATACRDGKVVVWNRDNLQILHSFSMPHDIRCVAFSPDGRYLAAGGYDGILAVWDTADGFKQMIYQRTQTGPVLRLAFTPDAAMLAYNGPAGVVYFVDVPSGRTASMLRAHEYFSRGIAFSADGYHIATSGGLLQKHVKIWDLPRVLQPRHPIRVGGWVHDACYTPDGSKILLARGRHVADAVGAHDVIVFDAKSQQRLLGYTQHTGDVRCVVTNATGTLAASGSNDHTIHVWDIETGDEQVVLAHHDSPVCGIAWNATTKTIVSFDQRGELFSCHSDTGAVVTRHTPTSAAISAVRMINSPTPGSSTLFVTVSDDGLMSLWNSHQTTPLLTVSAHEGAIRCLYVDPQSGLIATGSEDRTIGVWKLDTNASAQFNLLHRLRGHASTVVSLAMSVDSRSLASVGAEGRVLLWNLNTARETLALGQESFQLDHDPQQLMRHILFAPSGKSLASVRDNSMMFWDLNVDSDQSAPHEQRRLWHEQMQAKCHSANNPYGVAYHAIRLAGMGVAPLPALRPMQRDVQRKLRQTLQQIPSPLAPFSN